MALLENVMPSMIKANPWRRYVVCRYCPSNPEPLRFWAPYGTTAYLLDLSTKEGQTENWEAPVTLQRLCTWICHGFYIALAAAWDSLWLYDSLYIFSPCVLKLFPQGFAKRLTHSTRWSRVLVSNKSWSVYECLRVSTSLQHWCVISNDLKPLLTFSWLLSRSVVICVASGSWLQPECLSHWFEHAWIVG